MDKRSSRNVSPRGWAIFSKGSFTFRSALHSQQSSRARSKEPCTPRPVSPAGRLSLAAPTATKETVGEGNGYLAWPLTWRESQGRRSLAGCCPSRSHRVRHDWRLSISKETIAALLTRAQILSAFTNSLQTSDAQLQGSTHVALAMGKLPFLFPGSE